MTWVVLAVSVGLAAIGAAGILRPFGRRGAMRLERLADPLEDERSSLLRTLRDLDEERATGSLSPQDHAALRAETETRAVAVLRALEARDASGDLAAGLREVRDRANGSRPAAAPSSAAPRTRRSPYLPALLVMGALIAGTVPFLVRAAGQRAPGQSLSGDSLAAPTLGGLSFFEQRVEQHPNDVAARLDLAERYAAAGQDQAAGQQFVEVTRLDPSNAEAHAGLGMLLYRAGRPADALRAVQQALAVDPTYPEALYDEAIILLRGLNRPQDAAAAFRSYLAAAPFGAHRDEVTRLLSGLSPTP